MTIQRFRSAAVVAVGVTSACSEPVMTAPMSSDAAPSATSAPDITRSVFSCGVSRKVASGARAYEHREVRFHAPKRIGSLAEGVAKYKVIFRDPGQAPVAAIVCNIPNTAEALAYANDHFLPKDAEPRGKPEHLPVPSANGGALSSSAPSRSISLSPAAAAMATLPTITTTAQWTYSYWAESFGNDPYHLYYDGSFFSPDYSSYAVYDPSLDPTTNGRICYPTAGDTGIFACEQPLTELDKVVIQNALNAFLKDPSTLPYPANLMCMSTRVQLDDMLAADRVKRGLWDTGDAAPVGRPHWGAYNEKTGNIHIDPVHLDSALVGDAYQANELANTLLHEAMHAQGFDHPDDDGTIIPWPSYGPITIYSQDPFSYLNPGVNSCIRYGSA